MRSRQGSMRSCKTAAGILLLLLSATILIGCVSVKAPTDIDAAKARILDCGWDLSYTENAGELSNLASGFNFDCEGKLTAYLIAKDSEGTTILEVLFFESERDAESALNMLENQLSDSYRCGRSGCQIWYGTKSAVSTYLS